MAKNPNLADGQTYKVLDMISCRCMQNDTRIKIETGTFDIEEFKLAT